MIYNNIKGTGLNVSKFCLGTMTFGGQTSEEEALKIIDYAYNNGVNFFDTADSYTNRNSEKILGKALEGRRADAVIATKVFNPMGPLPNQRGLGRKHIMENLEISLRNLRTDYIDLLYLHEPDPTTPIEETIETMTSLVRSGKIRYYGLSNFGAWQFCSYVHKAKEMNGVAPVVTESVYNLITRGIEEELTPFLKEYQLGLTVYNPIAAGLLTGKHHKEKAIEGTRFAINEGYFDRYWKDDNFEAIERLAEIAKKADMSLVEFAITWLKQQKVVDSIILGASKYDHVVQNIDIVNSDKKIAPELLKECDAVWNDIKGNYFRYYRYNYEKFGIER